MTFLFSEDILSECAHKVEYLVKRTTLKKVLTPIKLMVVLLPYFFTEY